METQASDFEHHTETQRMNFISNLRKMFSYVGSTAKNYSELLNVMGASLEDHELLNVMGASLEDQQSFADTLLVPPAISDYADKIVAALQAGDEDVIREFISAIGGTHAVPDIPYSQPGFLVQWNFKGGSGSMFGIVTERLRLRTDGVFVSVTLLNRGEHLRTLVEDSFTPPITYPRQFGLAALMRASAVMMQAPFSFTVSIEDIITQTSYEWNGD